MPCDKTETDAQEDRIRTYAEGQNPLLRHRKNHFSGQLLKSACQLSTFIWYHIHSQPMTLFTNTSPTWCRVQTFKYIYM